MNNLSFTYSNLENIIYLLSIQYLFASMANRTVYELLQQRPMTAATLCRALEISQPTLSRRIAAAGSAIIRLGRGRASEYIATRRIQGQESFTVYRVGQAGQLALLGELIPAVPGFVLRRPDGSATPYHGLPWRMHDMRPQGYLGRALARRLATRLGVSPALQDWTDDHVVMALASGVSDMPGNLLIGERSRAEWLASQPVSITADTRDSAFVQQAQRATAGESPRASVGGEQPKFTTRIAHQDVIVKFSALDDNLVSRRWRDLLLAEHLALHFLRSNGFAAAESEILDVGTQRFLQISRFDRNDAGGRRGIVSLQALDAEFTGCGSGSWPQITAKLAMTASPRSKHRVITAEAHETSGYLYAFGYLIGNTDMHSGNLAFYHDGDLPLSLAPVYDMLPMGFAPNLSGEMRNVLAPFRLPAMPQAAVWLQMVDAARRYWQTVLTDQRASPDLLAIGKAQLAWLDDAEAQIQRAC